MVAGTELLRRGFKVRIRTVAGRVAIASLAIVAVPTALSGVASAKPKPVSPPATQSPAWDWITPAATHSVKIGHTLTIHGTDLSGATSATIGGVTVKIKKDTAKLVKLSTKGVPAGSDLVSVAFGVNKVGGTVTFAK
jgi:hypothetical protein